MGTPTYLPTAFHSHFFCGWRICALLAAFLMGTSLVKAADTPEQGELWGAVIVGALENDDSRETNPELQEFQEQLHKIFGYDRFRIAGEIKEPLTNNDFEVKTKHFSMALNYIRSKEPKKGEPRVHEFFLTLYQKDQLIVKAEVEATTGTPFYVRGPVWGSKEIILMILVK